MQEKSVITLESLDRPGTLNINGIEPVDLWTMLGPTIGIPMVLSLGGVPGIIAVPAGLLGLIVGVSIVYATPGHLNVVETVKVWRYYLKQPSEVRNFEDAATKSDNSIVKSIQTSKSTEDFLDIQRYYPEQNVIKRSDGSYAGLIKLHPPNLDFTSGAMTKITKNIGNYYNEQVDFDTTIYITTEPFNIDRYISNLEERRSSRDAQDKPIVKALLDEQISERPKQLKQTGAQKTQFYLLVETKQQSVQTSAVQDRTPVERLTEIPVLGIFAEIFINVSDSSTDLEQHGESLQTLKNRMKRSKKGISGSSDGWDATEAGLAEWMLFVQRFSKGRKLSGTAPIRQQNVQTTPVDAGPEDSPSNEEKVEDSSGESDGSGTDVVETAADSSTENSSMRIDTQSEEGTEPTEGGTDPNGSEHNES